MNLKNFWSKYKLWVILIAGLIILAFFYPKDIGICKNTAMCSMVDDVVYEPAILCPDEQNCDCLGFTSCGMPGGPYPTGARNIYCFGLPLNCQD